MHRAPHSSAAAAHRGRQTLLVLPRKDGGPLIVAMSAGVERFIGPYPRVPGFGGGGALLDLRAFDPRPPGGAG